MRTRPGSIAAVESDAPGNVNRHHEEVDPETWSTFGDTKGNNGLKAEGYRKLNGPTWVGQALAAAHDATELVKSGRRTPPILIDQGDADPFLEEQLRPEGFAAACRDAGVELELRLQPRPDFEFAPVREVRRLGGGGGG